MAQVPEAPQINPETFKKEEKDMVSMISGPITDYAELINEGLNQNLTFEENFRGEVRTLEFAKGETTKKFKYNGKGTPIGMWVVNQRNMTDSTVLNTAVVQPQWVWDGKGNINITKMLGLTADYKYNITIIIVAM